MDIETMKMAAQIIQNLASSGKEAFIWWLMVEGVLPRLLWVIGVCAALYTAYRIIKLVYDHNRLQESYDKAQVSSYEAMREIGCMLNVPGADYLSHDRVQLVKHNIIAAIGTAAMQKEAEK